MDLGTRIRKLRQQNNDTLTELAKKLDYSFGSLGKIERNEMTPSVELLERIAKIYNVPLFTLLADEYDGINSDWIMFAKEMEKRDLTPDEVLEIIKIVENIGKKH